MSNKTHSRLKTYEPRLKEDLREALEVMLDYKTFYTLDQLKTILLTALLKRVSVSEFYKYRQPTFSILKEVLPSLTRSKQNKTRRDGYVRRQPR